MAATPLPIREGVTGAGSMNPAGQPRSDSSWAWLGWGGALVAYGFTRSGVTGTAFRLTGAALVCRGLADRFAPDLMQPPQIEKAVTIMRSREELFEYCRNRENLLSLIEGAVAQLPESLFQPGRSLFDRLASGLMIEEVRSPEYLVLRSVSSPLIATAQLRFSEQAPGRGTIARLFLEYSLPGGAVGTAVAAALRKPIELVTLSLLHRLKQVMEAGEVSTTRGQPSGSTPATKSS